MSIDENHLLLQAAATGSRGSLGVGIILFAMARDEACEARRAGLIRQGVAALEAPPPIHLDHPDPWEDLGGEG